MKDVRRGWKDEDPRWFGPEALSVLNTAAFEISWLLERGYPAASALTFVSNHYLLSERQRTALLRTTASPSAIARRKQKEIINPDGGAVWNIDGFNAVILMETALSSSVVLKGMDGCYRDLSGLAGTYSVIERTPLGIDRIIRELQAMQAGGAVFYLDAPVSNSGRLKTCLAEEAEKLGFPIDIRMVHNADTELKKCDHVISGDAVILEECVSWYNLYDRLLAGVEDPWIVEINGLQSEIQNF